jgi:NADH:ubiquinone oxidoreductase subunit C
LIPIQNILALKNNFILHSVNFVVEENIKLSSMAIKMKQWFQSDNIFAILEKIGLKFVDATAIDTLEKKNRFSLIYTLINFTKKSRIYLMVPLLSPNIISYTASKIFSGAIAVEREIFDMFGLFFQKHGDLRRILTDYSFSGHPLKKDFPLTGYQQIQYSCIRKSILYNLINLSQEMRLFNHELLWQATTI